MGNFKLVTPHAAVVIWNFDDRGAYDDTKNMNIDEVVVSGSSLISISTNKKKSSPAGSFEFNLAPDRNWVATITPGSWCAILMSQNPITDVEKEANRNSFKMLGRIDSVRSTIDVDSETGMRKTTFVVTGQDWGNVFNTTLYIDHAFQSPNNDLTSAVSVIGVDAFAELVTGTQFPTPATIMDSIIGVWGTSNDLIKRVEQRLQSKNTKDFRLSFTDQFRLPQEVAKFMKQGNAAIVQTNFADLIKAYHGRLTSQDGTLGVYKRVADSAGVPDVASFFGMNSFWQLLVSSSNHVLYEVLTDTRWEGDTPKFALYHRIKPFTVRDSYPGSQNVSHIDNKFKYIRKINIDLNDVLNINYGTNWRDKINFLEIRPGGNLLNGNNNIAAALKKEGQITDKQGYMRDGFKARIETAFFAPHKDGKITPLLVKDWKYLLKEWYFNTHLMLNGVMTIIGQDDYIQVGDNIAVPSEILGSAPINAKQADEAFLLAHVEAVSHEFTVDQSTGARNFITKISFVRGIIADKDGVKIGSSASGAIDTSSAELPIDRERLGNVVKSPSENEPK